MRILFIILSLWVAFPAPSQEVKQTSQVPNDEQSERLLQNQQGGGQDKRPPPATTSRLPEVSTTVSEPKCCSEAKAHEEEGTEFWPPFLGYRLKITDTLVAGFTALLFWATWLLWRATKKLVRGADETARRQLRAYVSVEPSQVFNFGTPNRIGVMFQMQNHGGTPASEISHDFEMGALDNPLPPDFEYPTPTRQLDTDSTLFPNSVVPVRLFHNADMDDVETAAVENDQKRFHFWGVTHYRDAFGVRRTTQFRASFGGPDFARTTDNFRKGKFGPDGKAGPGWTWNWSPGHNEAT